MLKNILGYFALVVVTYLLLLPLLMANDPHNKDEKA